MAKKSDTSTKINKASTARGKKARPETPPWVARYLACLREIGIAGYAARVAGIKPRVVDARRSVDTAFAAAYAEAIEEALDLLEAEARRRALHEGNDLLLVFLLQAALPTSYRALGRLSLDELRRLGQEVLAAPPTAPGIADNRSGA